MLDIEHIDGDMMISCQVSAWATCSKADGNAGAVEGPWAFPDETTLGLNTTRPQWTIDDRYAVHLRSPRHTTGTTTRAADHHRNAQYAACSGGGVGDYTALKSLLVANFDTCEDDRLHRDPQLGRTVG